MKIKLFILSVLFTIGLGSELSAQTNYQNYIYFIYTIAKNTQWPANLASGDFVIGVYGDSELTSHLNKMASSKRISGRSIKVVKFNSVGEIKNCNMLFVPESKSNELHLFVGRATAASILVMTEQPGLAKRGSGVNFINTTSGKLGFELNVAAIKSAQLKISSDLIRFAEVL